jgi:hypothetical protein
MTTHDILQQISNDFFEDNNTSDIEEMIENGIIDKEVKDIKWLGFPPANEQEILRREKYLGTTLPPSYKDFLLTSNGFRFISFFLDNLFPIEKIEWARNTEENWWFQLLENSGIEVSDEQYFYYGKDQDTVLSRDEYYRESLKISNWYDGMCVFLNPMIKSGDEWEVLVYATWYPGTKRFRSFKEFLIETHEENLELSNGRDHS